MGNRMTSATGHSVWIRARTLKKCVGDLVWHIEGPWLWRTRHEALRTAPPPLFIGGTGGSGTRVVARIAELAGVFMGTYLNHAYDALPTIRRYSEKWNEYVGAKGATLTQVQQRLMNQDLGAALIKHRARIPHPMSPWGVKNPRFIFFLSHLHHCFPELKFIHVIRDGRDMAFAERQYQLEGVGGLYLDDLKTRLCGAPAPVRSIALWSQVNLETARFGEGILGGRYLRIRLEDLCASPAPLIQKIFEFLDTSSPNLPAALSEVKPPSSLGRWRDQDPALLDRLHAEGRAGLGAFGYLES
jgi:hypothetical protein